MIWVDAEVHLFPPEWCTAEFWPEPDETALRRAIYSHPDRDRALAGAHADGCLAEMERCGIDRAVIMGLPWMSAEACEQNNRYIASVAREHAGRFTGLGVLPPPEGRDAAGEVRRLVEVHGLRGLKVIPSWQGYRLDDPVFEPWLDACEAHDLVLFPHTDHAFRSPEGSDTVASLYEVARRHPELRILAPHLGGMLCLYALHEPVAAALGRMLFVGSVPLTMKMVRFAWECVGPERIAFGTDFPFNPSHDQKTPLAELCELGLPRADLERIAGLNVLEFLGEPA